jgi:hypothetical protein
MVKKTKVERPKRFRFQLPLDKGMKLIIDGDHSNSYIEFVLDKDDNLMNAKFVLVSKEKPKIRHEYHAPGCWSKIVKRKKSCLKDHKARGRPVKN